MRIVRSDACGNSPKNVLLESLTVALAGGDVDAALGLVSDDVVWTRIGRGELTGRIALADALRSGRRPAARRLTLHHVVSHGWAGAVDGTLELAGGAVVDFCDVHEFASAKGSSVRRIVSYRIER